MTFNKLALHPALLSAISTLGYDEPTSIQTEAIPPILKGRDLIGMAKTGSGKTASFAFPILSKLVASAPAQKSRAPKILILVPTRELAVQVGDVFISIAQKLPRTIKVLSIHGGVSINPQMKAIYGAEILIATPGRMLDLQRSNAVDLSQVGILVLDEADKILNLGFQKKFNPFSNSCLPDVKISYSQPHSLRTWKVSIIFSLMILWW